jgi:hypothetical protein
MKLSCLPIFRLVAGLVSLLFAPLTLRAQQTIVATSGQVGVAYSYQVTSNATPPVQYSASGLPAGLAINSSSGLITGTPTTAGTVVGTVSVTAGGQTNSANISITIAAAAGTPVITSATTATGTVGVAFTYLATASNNPTSFNITGLPAGLSATAAGVISGTPTTAGASSISLSANNASGTGATVTLTLTIGAAASAPVITSSSTASVAVNAAFSYTITATNTPTSFAATGLPLGLSLDTATGAITGTPTVAGVYTIGLTATNGSGTSATVNLALTVGALSSITSATSQTAAVGVAFTYNTTASPAATSFNITGLPAGLTANTSTGVISGTPTVAGVSSISLSANNATGSGPVTTLTLTVGNRPVVTSVVSASGTVGSPFSYTILASFSPTSYNATGLPAGLSINTTTGVISGTPTAAGTSSVALTATNNFGTGNAVTLTITISPVTIPPSNVAPAFTQHPQGANAAIGASVTLSATATGTPAPTYQWRLNGVNITGATTASLTLSNLQVSDAGVYTVTATNVAGTATSQPALVGITSTAKVAGAGSVVRTAIVHPNGNVYDQLVLTGASASITADAGKVTRISFIDLTDDIVQVEFSGAGTLSIVLDSSSGPALAVNYNQPDVSYMRGHASLVVAGANETTNLSVFTVGKVTAFDPTGAYNLALPISAANNPANNASPLFQGHAATAYDGVADIASVSISSANGKFGGLRTANASYFATAGNTGVYAPGVQFTGPVYVGDINASNAATPVLLLGSSTVTQINGGDLQQSNGLPVSVSGITQLQFVAGLTSANATLPVQANKAVLRQNGTDVTGQIVVYP